VVVVVVVVYSEERQLETADQVRGRREEAVGCKK
jgi:hypothetical protein